MNKRQPISIDGPNTWGQKDMPEKHERIKESDIIIVNGATAYYDRGHSCLMLESIPDDARIYVNGREATITCGGEIIYKEGENGHR